MQAHLLQAQQAISRDLEEALAVIEQKNSEINVLKEELDNQEKANEELSENMGIAIIIS
jgi:hypothetical protein